MTSIIAMALKWTGLSQGVMELITIGVLLSSVGGFAVYEHHKIFEEGIHAQQATDAKQAAIQVAAITAQKVAAEKADAQHQKDLAQFIADHPLQPIRLCLNKIVLPAAKSAAPSAAAGSVQQVPAGDSSSGEGTAGPDISAMLDALGAAADRVTNDYRSQVQ